MTRERLAALLPTSSARRLELTRVRFLLERLGSPQRKFPSIQVGGGQGKSCVIAILESILAAGGIRVGAYDRPDGDGRAHSARVMGDPIPEEDLLAEAEMTLHPFSELLDGPGRPTFPEALAAAVMSRFAKERVELALLEAGGDSRRDALCQLTRPLLALVTPVNTGPRALDLGQAALNEVGLAWQGIPFLTTEWKDTALAVFARECRDRGAALVLVDQGDVQLVEASWHRAVWRSRTDPLGLGEFETGFLGAYQGANLALALGALAELVGGIAIPREAVREGLAGAHLPGKFEVISRRPYVVLDGARSEDDLGALASSLERLPHPGGRRRLFCGPGGPALGGLPKRTFDGITVVDEDAEEALERTLSSLGEDDVLVVCGRPAFLKEARGVVDRTAR
jgi:dihydrofolate synthase/folylpolyglutamate synthase